MRNSTRTLFVAIVLSAPLAHAQEWYAGFGAGQGEVSAYPLPVVSSDGGLTSYSFSPVGGRDTMLTARLGARIHRNIAIEAGYFRFGEYAFDTLPVTGDVTRLTARVRSGGLALVGLLPVGQMDLYARAGMARTELKADTGAGSSSVTARERFNEAYYGAGVRWNITPQAGLFAEYQRHDKLELDGFFAGFDWRF